MTDYSGPVCATCAVRACSVEPGTVQSPSFCPMPSERELLAEIERAYLEQEEVRKLALASARTAAAGYGRATRIEEMMDFARRIGAQKLGIAHCVGLMREARLAREIFSAGGFEVYTACCKVGSIAKEAIGLEEADKIGPASTRPCAARWVRRPSWPRPAPN